MSKLPENCQCTTYDAQAIRLAIRYVDCIVLVAVCVWGSTHVQAKPFGATLSFDKLDNK